jgi:hypothetical protein
MTCLISRTCKENGPAYSTFRLKEIFDVDAASDHRRWDSVHVEMGRLNVDLTYLQFLTPELQQHLQALLYATTVNLTNHRTQVCYTYPMLYSANVFAGTLMFGINLKVMYT